MQTDVIIVLGAAVWPNEQPSPPLARRVTKAVELYKHGVAGHIIMSGGRGKHPPAEAVVMQRLAVNMGVPPDAIILEDSSSSTFDNARHCVAIMKQHHWKDALVVSDSYHILRSVFVFRALGRQARGVASEGRGDTATGKWIFYHLREVAAILWYGVRLALLKLSLLNKN